MSNVLEEIHRQGLLVAGQPVPQVCFVKFK
jgi:hypothetical protein